MAVDTFRAEWKFPNNHSERATAMKTSATKLFAENVNLFSDPKQNPKEYNLFMGLHALSQQVDAMQQQLAAQAHEIQQLRQALQSMRYPAP